MSDYGDFARFYDKFTKNVNYEARARYFDAIIQKYNPNASILLDLACGTGSLSFELEKYSYDIVAVDNSFEMNLYTPRISTQTGFADGRSKNLCCGRIWKLHQETARGVGAADGAGNMVSGNWEREKRLFIYSPFL